MTSAANLKTSTCMNKNLLRKSLAKLKMHCLKNRA